MQLNAHGGNTVQIRGRVVTADLQQSVLFGLRYQLVLEVGVGNADESFGALAKRAAGKIRNAELGHDTIGQVLVGGDDRAGAQAGHNRRHRTTESGAVHDHETASPRGHVGAPNEVRLTAR